VGSYCQYNEANPNIPIADYTCCNTACVNGTCPQLNFLQQVVPGSVQVTVPAGLLGSAAGVGHVYIIPYTTDVTIQGQQNPLLNPPSSQNAFCIATNIGFTIDATCTDNSPYSTCFANNADITINATIDNTELFPNDFVSLQMYRYVAGASPPWQPINSGCCSLSAASFAVDFSTYTFQASLCSAGQYQIFNCPGNSNPIPTGLSPLPNHGSLFDSFTVTATTGDGGRLPPQPKQPQFSPNQAPVSGKQVIGSASIASLSTLAVVASILAILM